MALPLTNGQLNGEDSDHSPVGFTAVNASPAATFANGQITAPSSTDVSPTSEDRKPNGLEGYAPSTQPPSSIPDRGEPGGDDTIRLKGPAGEHDDASSHKRKRSRSSSDEDENSSPTSHYDHSPPKRSEPPQHVAARAMDYLGSTTHSRQSSYTPLPNGTHAEAHGIPPVQTNGEWTHHAPVPQGPFSDGGRFDASETRLFEALQHEHEHERDGQQTPQRPHGLAGSPETDARSDGPASYSSEQPTPQGSGQVGKRKRNFSNRTKTGCITCRRRKKKCGEEKPMCKNCSRGGFTCEGYSQKGYMKQNSTIVPVPLQSKSGYTEVVNDPANLGHHHHHHHRPGSEGGQLRPIVVDENGYSHFSTSPQSAEPRSRGSYPGQGQAWPQQQQQPQLLQQQQQQQQQPQQQQQQQQQPPQSHASYLPNHLPPFSELSRPEGSGRPDSSSIANSRDVTRPSSHYPSQPQSSQMSGPPAVGPPPGQWQPPQQAPAPSGYRPAPPPPPPQQQQHLVDPNSPQSSIRTTPVGMPAGGGVVGAMSMVDSKPQPPGAKTFFSEDVEKSRMVRRRGFNYYDPILVRDRRRCRTAVKRYNSVTDADIGLDEKGVYEILLKIFDPSRDPAGKTLQPPIKERGYLGHGVMIDAPFECSYGYNIRIGDEVSIGKGCWINDSCNVDIGPRVSIGEDVKIMTVMHDLQMINRKGTGGKHIGKPVVIETEVIIGSHAVIYPGVILHRGSTVEPGAVVKESLGPNQTHHAASGGRTG